MILDIIDKTPLVSIDLIIKDSNNRALLGYRNNHPARGFGLFLVAAFENETR